MSLEEKSAKSISVVNNKKNKRTGEKDSSTDGSNIVDTAIVKKRKLKDSDSKNRQEVKKKDKKNSKKNKRKKKKSPPPPPKESTRDFSGDLETYLSSWYSRGEQGNWKFNKLIQNWALDNCFDVRKIDQDLFKQLLPYILTVQGGAIERTKSQIEEILNGNFSVITSNKPSVSEAVATHEDGDEDGAVETNESQEEIEKVNKSALKRAVRIRKALDLLKQQQ